MKRPIVVLLSACTFFAAPLRAQFLEAGAIVGGSNYHGDLTPKEVVESFRHTHWAFSGLLRYNFNDYFTGRATLTYCAVSSNDAQSTDQSLRYRNLSFSSNIFEAALGLEWNILGYQPHWLEKPLTPYGYLGVAVFHFNPRTKYQGRWVDLQPLGTEGQGTPLFPGKQKYRLTDLAIPFGGGIKYALTERFNIGLEIIIRKLFTDYLDDVSTVYVAYNDLLRYNGPVAAALSNRTGEYLGSEPLPIQTGSIRGNPRVKDWYLTGGLFVTYNLYGSGWTFFRRQSKGKKGFCPAF